GNEEARNQAIVLSGAYRVKEVVPTLLDILNKKDRLGTEANLKTMLVKALGEIGD
ncbi:MAG: HEAT repeat domain-containing protein, partial [Desulfobacterales bacterium]|nr:HEAT repeat domain-containing protein [Desulfobacterales bacterium]